MLIRLLLALLLVSQTVHALEYEQFTLDNGMEIVIVPDHRTPVVIHSVWYRAGSADEPTGKTGIAHMLEHLMFKGTETVPPGEFSKRVAAMGGQDNAFTSRDYTAYYQKIGKDRLADVMELEADRMANLVLTDDVFLPERDVVLEERSWRVDSRPVSQFWEKLYKQFLPQHPYGNPVIGWREDIENYTVDDALTWYKHHYVPNNATMILLGDITRAEAEPLIRQYYEPLKAGEVTHKVWPRNPLPTEARRLEEVDAQVKVPVFARLYRAPSVFGVEEQQHHPRPPLTAKQLAKQQRTALALALLAQVLGDGETGLLHRELVVAQELATSASASYYGVLRGETGFSISAEPKPGVTLRQLERAVDAVLADFVANPPAGDELERAKVSFLAQDVYGRDDLFNATYQLGLWLMAGGTPDTYDLWQTQLDSITTADLLAAFNDVVQPTRSLTGLLAGTQEQM